MLHKLLFALNDVAWAYNHGTKAYVFVSPNVQQVLGVSAEIFSADMDLLINLIIPTDREQVVTAIGKMKHGDWADLYYRIKVDGKQKWIHDKRTNFTDELTGDDITLTVIKDVSDQNTVKHHLSEALGDFSILFDNSPSPMWIYEAPSLRIIKVNNAAITHYGYSSKEFLSMTIRDIRPKFDLAAFNDYMFRRGITKGNSSGSNTGGIWRHQNKQGEIIYAEITGHEIKYANTTCRIIIATNVTERIRFEEEKRLAENTDNSLQG